MPTLRKFPDMSKDDRLDFFQRCQNLLVKTQPNSPWIMKYRQEHDKTFFLDVFLKYQGFVYESNNIILLYNTFSYNSKEEAQESYALNLFAPPDENPNTYTIDFIASEIDADKVSELKPYFEDSNIKYITFLRGNRPAAFDIDRFKEAMLNKFF